MFTIADICDIAVQIEHNGESAYRQASDQVGDPELARVLRWMADEERRHAKWFEGLRGMGHQAQGDYDQLEAMGRTLLNDMLENQTFSLELGNLTSERAVDGLILQSIEFEKDTILFYQMLRDFLDDSHAEQHLDLIIAEERQHVAMLENFAPIEDMEGVER